MSDLEPTDTDEDINFHECGSVYYHKKHKIDINNVMKTILFDILIVQHDEETDSLNLEVILTNTEDENMMYSACVTSDDYQQNLKKQQNLLVAESEFAEALARLFAGDGSANERVITLEFDETNNSHLYFWAKTDIRMVPLLYLVMAPLCSGRKIAYFNNKSLHYQTMFLLQQKLYERELETVNFEKKKEITEANARIHSLEVERNELRENVKDKNEEMNKMTIKLKNVHARNDELTAKLKTVQGELRTQTETVSSQKSLVNKMKKQLDAKKNNVCAKKYEHLKSLCVKTMEQLKKHQVYLTKTVELGEVKKAQNKRLKQEIQDCLRSISVMERNVETLVNNDKIFETIGEENADTHEILDQAQNLLERLKFKVK